MNKRISLLAAVLLGIWALLPFYQTVLLALEPPIDYFANPPYIYPAHLTFSNLISALKEALYQTTPSYFPSLHATIINSTVLATVVMVVTMAMALPSGYAFARFNFALRNTIFFLIIFARALPPVSLIIPFFLFYAKLNIIGTFQGVIPAELTLTVPIAVWVTSGVFSSIPLELDRQARIDGASRWETFRKVLIPIAAPGLLAVATISWLTAWNEYVLSTYLGDLGNFWTVFGIGTSPAELLVVLVPSVVAVLILQRFMTTLRLISPPMATTKEPSVSQPRS